MFFCFVLIYHCIPIIQSLKHIEILSWATESKKRGFLSRRYTPTILDLAHLGV